MGADDIFANGNNTSIDLPRISEKGLLDLSGKPFWVEDYITADTDYSSSTKGYDDSDYKAIRYRMLTKNDVVYTVESATYTNYICLTLGYTHLMATIKKLGLKEGESAVFYVYEGIEETAGSGTYTYGDTPYLTVVLTGTGETDTPVSKTFAITAGKWKVKETQWSWGYTTANAEQERVINNASLPDDKIFSFSNTPKEDLPKKEYDETIIVNVMGDENE